jgi:excinuclease ABC subunit B
MDIKVESGYTPSGDQPQAIEEIVSRIEAGEKSVVLEGATGTGKTATTAWIIEKLNRPTLIIEPNKTLAAQLCSEFREFMPNNAIEYFVSYYDYYQPEAYIAQTDTYIEKDSSINDEIERLRHHATVDLISRRDTVVVSSVSCIYGLGEPKEYLDMIIHLKVGQEIDRDALIMKLVANQYSRNDFDKARGTFQVKGDTLEVIPMYENNPIRIEMFGDEIERLTILEPITLNASDEPEQVSIFPASHYVASEESLKRAIKQIEEELKVTEKDFLDKNKLIEAQRIKMRTRYDLDMLRQTGFTKGIENYSRHMDGRNEGEPPSTLIDYFPDDFLLVIDESHITIPQIGAMYNGDQARKRSLVDYGFRLPSAKDNRPLNFEEFENRVGQTLYLSATPGPYELEQVNNDVVYQVIRPTGLIDPEIEVLPTDNQIEVLIKNIRERIERGQRTLVTTLTKRMAEDLTKYLEGEDIKVSYLHSSVETIERVEILRSLRKGTFDVLVGINLLREGLDLPEVGLVCIMDADKQGFLRSYRSLIQTIGRAARNIEGKVIMFGDTVTEQMQAAIDETNRRRTIQKKYNEDNNIDPAPIVKKIQDVTDMLEELQILDGDAPDSANDTESSFESDEALAGLLPDFEIATATPRNDDGSRTKSKEEMAKTIEWEIKKYTKYMKKAASELNFELAAQVRDRIQDLKKEIKKL